MWMIWRGRRGFGRGEVDLRGRMVGWVWGCGGIVRVMLAVGDYGGNYCE